MNAVLISIRQELLNGTTQISREEGADIETQICAEHGMEIKDAYGDQTRTLNS